MGDPRPTPRSIRRLLRRAHAGGMRAHPAIALPPAAFEAEVLARLERRLARAGVPASEARLGEVLRASVSADLYLVIACDQRVPGAWEALLAEHLPRLQALLVKRGAPEGTAREIAEDLPGILVATGRDAAHSHLASYDGAGSLFAWLGAIALRRFYRGCRRSQRAGVPLEGLAVEPVAPARLPLDGEAEQRFARAMAGVWAELSPRQRDLLVQKYVEGRQQTDIAYALGIGPPRVSRLLDATVQKVRDAVHAEFAEPEWRELPHFWNALRTALQAQLAIRQDPGHHGAGELHPTRGRDPTSSF